MPTRAANTTCPSPVGGAAVGLSPETLAYVHPTDESLFPKATDVSFAEKFLRRSAESIADGNIIRDEQARMLTDVADFLASASEVAGATVESLEHDQGYVQEFTLKNSHGSVVVSRTNGGFRTSRGYGKTAEFGVRGLMKVGGDWLKGFCDGVAAAGQLERQREERHLQQREKAIEAREARNESRPCWVYFFHDRSASRVKIGISVAPIKRLRQKQHDTGADLELIACVSGGLDDEHEYHERFGHRRLHGEWFVECPEILELAATLGVDPQIAEGLARA
jgi:hypothetical protein